MNKKLGVIADIGGTNARFALCDNKFNIKEPLVLPCADFSNPTEALFAYLDFIKTSQMPSYGAFAVASAILEDKVKITNNNWNFSIEQTRKNSKLEKLEVVNDFVAQALAIPNLKEEQKIQVGKGKIKKGFPIGVIGPGTGLGVSYLIRTNNEWRAVPTEGGHATIAPATNYESLILDTLRHNNQHISAERVISGFGLVNLYNAISIVKEKKTPPPLEPAEISQKASQGEPLCKEALEMMFAMLGTVCGNLALTTGALGGIYIAGGIIPRDKIIDIFKESKFRERFEQKGRFVEYMKKIPTFVINHEYPAFLGLSYLIKNLFNTNN